MSTLRPVQTLLATAALVVAPWLAVHGQASTPAPGKVDASVRGTPADVKFMQGMIGHHAQALWMAALAPTHGASSSLRTLAQRIDVSQRDEIASMQRWLRERGETVPDENTAHHMSGHTMPGMPMPAVMMPGMLTHEQMMQLDAARGAEFDRLFLTLMIQHHQGALAMVDQLFASPGAGQEPAIFRFASDVIADQTAEIQRMQSMLGP